MTLPPIVVIGASSGGVSALLELTAALPPDFRAIVAIVLHVGGLPSILPELINRRGPNRAMHAVHGERPVAGVIYVAPPDHHLLLAPDAIRLSRSARENYARPAIDPLFRTAALGWRERAIGVVLTGTLDDGTAGLAAIKRCGGIAIVQDPATALEPSMPASALAHVAVDHCLPLELIAAELEGLVARPPPSLSSDVPDLVRHEQHAFETQQAPQMVDLTAVATPSALTCPECGGGLWEIMEGRPLRYRCHTGHAYSALSLADAQTRLADEALWKSLRSLKEREMLLRRLAGVSDSIGDIAQAQAQAGRQQAELVKEQARRVCELIGQGARDPWMGSA